MRIYIPSKMVRNSIIIGFLLAFSAVAMVSYLAYDSVHDLVLSLKKISIPKQNQITLKEVYADLLSAESSVRAYTISQDSKDLKPFYVIAKGILFKTDSLMKISSQKNTMDSINSLIENKFLTMIHLIYATDDGKVRQIFDQLADKLVEAAEKKSLAPPHKLGESSTQREDDEITNEVELKSSVENEKSYNRNKQDPQDSGSLFAKILGNKRKNTSSRTIVDSILESALPFSDTLTTPRDILFYLQDRSFEDTLQISEPEEDQFIRQRVTLIRTLVKKDQLIMSRIQTLIKTIEYNQRVSSHNEVDSANDKAERTISFMGSLSLIGLTLFILLVIILFRDISRHQRLQKKLRNEKARVEKLAHAKEEFLANISHEIRTPMNAIIGFTEQFYGTRLTRIQQRFLQNINHSAKHLMALINDVLDYSKLESGNFKLEKTGFRPSDIIEEVYATFQNTAEEKGIDWQCHQESVLPDILVGDPLRLKQMLFNLVSNAVKFTDKGKVNLTCRAETISDSDVFLNFLVEDTGIGIPENKLDHIFKDFSQADSSTTRKYGGTGLGLAITRRLAEMHKGSIHLKSRVGHGTSVSLQLKYTMGQVSDLETQEPIVIDTKTYFKGMKALVADDAPYNLELIRAILEKWKVKVTLVENGRDAVNCVKAHDYDFVLMDLQMPELDGIAAVEEIRNILKSDVPVLALTATSTPSEISKCIEKGMQACLLKPFKEKDLAEKLVEILHLPVEDDSHGALVSPQEGSAQEVAKANINMNVQLTKLNSHGVKGMNNGNGEHESPSILKADGKPYDLKELYELANHDMKFLVNMLKIFIKNTPKYLEDLNQKLEEKDWEGVANMAHKMVPPCRHLHLNNVVQELKVIEDHSKMKIDLEMIEEKTAILSMELKAILSSLKEEIDRLEKDAN